MSQRNEKIANHIKELAAQFLNRADNKTSLITITACSVSPDLKRATIFVTVFPLEKESAAVNFIKRNLGNLRGSLKEDLSIKTIPFLEVEIDQGEKNRQKIDELLHEK
jgi:ribosome-binding factor A